MPDSMLASLVLVHADVYWFVYGCGADVAELASPERLTAAMGIWTQADRKLDAGGHEN